MRYFVSHGAVRASNLQMENRLLLPSSPSLLSLARTRSLVHFYNNICSKPQTYRGAEEVVFTQLGSPDPAETGFQSQR